MQNKKKRNTLAMATNVVLNTVVGYKADVYDGRRNTIVGALSRIVSGNNNVVLGSNCTITGNDNVVIGDNLIVEGNNCFVTGAGRHTTRSEADTVPFSREIDTLLRRMLDTMNPLPNDKNVTAAV